ncbi:fluoride efflux transporter CrcB [Nocardia veterana]|uniref:fluoride efflux transporter CrcB n=1 Tax=Nocardia veterana TaxID=132249 RepID=UPI0003049BBE|nr:fluoride efflux transporter CrcB [Nocardia veterana]
MTVFRRFTSRVDAATDRPAGPGTEVGDPAPRRELLREQLPVLAVIALGGGLGGLARYGLTGLLPTRPGRFPWGTFAENVLGCLAIGVLMVLITEVWSAHRLVRPFLGVGFLGGFTTFSTYAVEIRALLAEGAAAPAFGYLAATLVSALAAVVGGVTLARMVLLRRLIRQEAR